VTSAGPDREVDQIERKLFEGSTRAGPHAQRQHDLAASLTAALFGAIDDAPEAEAQEASNE
jgi:hypothetical protein